MKSRIQVILISLLVPVSLYGYKYDVDSIPVQLRENTPVVVRSEQMVCTLLSPKTARISFKFVYTVMNEKGDELRYYKIPYDKSTPVQSIHASMYDSKGELIEVLSASRIMDVSDNDQFVSDARAKWLFFPACKYPYTMQVEYDQNVSDFINLPGWQFHSDPSFSVEESAVQYIVPMDIPFRYKEYWLESRHDSVIMDKNIVYTWTERAIPAIKEWYYSPLAYARMPFLLTASGNFECGGIKGSLSSWNEFGKWQAELNKGLDELTAEEQARINKMVSGITDEREKVRVLYKYMQSKTRYVSIQLGIGGLKPFPASFVSEKGYGDCKALSNYMLAILKAAGIKSFYTLVKAGANKNIVSSFVSDQFDHIILCVPMQPDTVWLECTSQTLPFNHLGYFTSNRDVLLITPEGGKLVRTPPEKNNFSETSGKIDIRRRDDAIGELVVRSGGNVFDASMAFLEEAPEELKRDLNYSLPFGTFSVDTAIFSTTADDEPLSRLYYKVKLNDFAISDGSRIHFKPCFEPMAYKPFDTIPVRVFDSSFSRDSITFSLPSGFVAERLPEPVVMDTPYGKYSYSISGDGNGSLVFIRELQIKSGRYETSEARRFFEFLNSIARSDNRKVYLVRSQV